MTSIAGVSSFSSSDLVTLLQELARKRAEEAGTVTSGQTSQTSEPQGAGFESKFDDALTAAGLDPSKLDEVKNAIKSAVSSALSSSNGTTDPREVVSQAVDQTLQQYGVDTAKLKEQMKSQMGSMRPPGGGGMRGPNGLDSKLTDALNAAGVDSSLLDEIKSAIQSAISTAAPNSDGSGKPGATVKAAVHEVLDKYGVDKGAFDKQMESGMGTPPGGPPDGQSLGSTDSQSQGGTLFNFMTSGNESNDSSWWTAGLFQYIDEQA